ncbi:hypothetical protein NQZ68_000693 [Dissostichus eleginoides]|nr:hypothetical protein NQZ68_000693 [Dissostichus eleginoides]
MQLLCRTLGGDNPHILFPVSSSSCNIQALTLRRWTLLWSSPGYIGTTNCEFQISVMRTFLVRPGGGWRCV